MVGIDMLSRIHQSMEDLFCISFFRNGVDEHLFIIGGDSSRTLKPFSIAKVPWSVSRDSGSSEIAPRSKKDWHGSYSMTEGPGRNDLPV